MHRPRKPAQVRRLIPHPYRPRQPTSKAIMSTDLHGKRALVMGLGIHGGGLGVARFLVAQGAEVTVTDLRDPEQLRDSLTALSGLPVRYVLGRHDEQDFRTADLVVQNPAVPRDAIYLRVTCESGATLETEMTLFFRRCPGP